MPTANFASASSGGAKPVRNPPNAAKNTPTVWIPRGSTLVVNYQTPSVRARAGRVMAGLFARLGGAQPITAGEPWHTLLSCGAMARLLTDVGFGVQADEDLLTVAERLQMPIEHATSLRNGRVAVAARH